MHKVSVVMPVYNTKADYFKEAIDSVLGQSFQDFELQPYNSYNLFLLTNLMLFLPFQQMIYYQ